MTKATHNIIKAARKAHGFTLWQISKLCHISSSYYWNIENGYTVPTIDIAQKIGKLLDISWEVFYKE